MTHCRDMPTRNWVDEQKKIFKRIKRQTKLSFDEFFKAKCQLVEYQQKKAVLKKYLTSVVSYYIDQASVLFKLTKNLYLSGYPTVIHQEEIIFP